MIEKLADSHDGWDLVFDSNGEIQYYNAKLAIDIPPFFKGDVVTVIIPQTNRPNPSVFIYDEYIGYTIPVNVETLTFGQFEATDDTLVMYPNG